MAGTELADLPALTAPSADDLLYVVDNPAGTPVDKQATVASVLAAPASSGATVTGARSSLLNNAKSMVLIDDPADDEVNGLVFKFRETAYVAQDYGEGQPFMLLNDGDGDVQTNVFANGTISAATNATPIVLTVNAVGTVVTGDVVFIYGVLGNTAANGWHKVTKVDATHLSLDGVAGNGAYTSGGAWYCNRSPVLARMDWPSAFGLSSPIHLAVGIRGVSGFAGYGPSDPALWIDLSQDVVGIAIHNPSAVESVTAPTANFLTINDTWNTGNERALFKIGADGTVTIRPKFGRAAGDFMLRIRTDDDTADNVVITNNGAIVGTGTIQGAGFTSTGSQNLFTTPTAATVAAIISNSNATPTADILRVRSAGVTKFVVNKGGYPIWKALTAAIADADLAAGEMALWLDATNGACKLMVKAKEAGGTVRTGSLALA